MTFLTFSVIIFKKQKGGFNMKFRTDFVTNSSSSSFLIFNVKHPELYNFLTALGLKIEGADDGEFNDGMTFILPSGEKFELYCEEADWLPSPTDCSSVSSWIMEILLCEIENVYPAKELDEYSDFTMELLKLLNEKSILTLSEEEVENWDRDMLDSKLTEFDKMDKSLEKAEVEINTGFEGEVCTLETFSSHNGYSLSIYSGDCEYEAEDLSKLKIFIHDTNISTEAKERLIEFIQQNKGTVVNTLSEDTDYVVCDDFNLEDETTNFAKSVCIPIISEQGFMYHFGATSPLYDEDNDEDVYNMLYECTWEGGYDYMFHRYGIGNVIRHKL